MRLSLSITNYSWPGGPASLGTDIARIVRAADEGGLDTVWVADHLIQYDPTSTPDSEMLEAYTTLGFVAAQTQRVRLGTMVTGVTFRPPSLLIKAVTTLDVLSGGRAWLGVGAGYHEEEARAMDLPLPPVGERFERLDETLRLALQMWSGDSSPFEGRHYRLDRPVSNPPALREPHPPILIGGMGERKTLRLVAEYADACNLFDIPDGGKTIRRKLERARTPLRGGRPPVPRDREDRQHAAGKRRVAGRVRRAVRPTRRARHRACGGHHRRSVDRGRGRPPGGSGAVGAAVSVRPCSAEHDGRRG